MPDLKRTGHCVIVFVALDEDGPPAAGAPWTPVTDTDRALQAYALRLIELRKLMDAELESHLALLEQSTAGRHADRLLHFTRNVAPPDSSVPPGPRTRTSTR